MAAFNSRAHDAVNVLQTECPSCGGLRSQGKEVQPTYTEQFYLILTLQQFKLKVCMTHALKGITRGSVLYVGGNIAPSTCIFTRCLNIIIIIIIAFLQGNGS